MKGAFDAIKRVFGQRDTGFFIGGGGKPHIYRNTKARQSNEIKF